jgi:hypothetical protein
LRVLSRVPLVVLGDPQGCPRLSSAFNEAQGILVLDDIIEAHFFFEVYASPTP